MKVSRFLVLGLCACWLQSCHQKEQVRGNQVNYPLLTLKPETRTFSVKYSAVVEGKQDVEVRPQVSGTITQVCVEEGAKVRKGQVLFVIDQVPYQAALLKAEAAVATAEATLRRWGLGQKQIKPQPNRLWKAKNFCTVTA